MVGYQQPVDEFARAVGQSRFGIVAEVFRGTARHGAQHAALGDGAVEQALGGRSRHQREYILAAGAFAENRHVRRVAAEGRNVVVHPLQAGDLVEQTEVAGSVGRRGRRVAQRRMAEPAEYTEPVLQRHHDHSLAAGQMMPQRRIRETERVAAAMDPHHHRQPLTRGLLGGELRSPDIQIQAILAAGAGVAATHREQRQLRARFAMGECGARALPGRKRLRRAPAQVAQRRLRKRNTEPRMGGVLVGEARQRTGSRGAERAIVDDRPVAPMFKGEPGKQYEQ